MSVTRTVPNAINQSESTLNKIAVCTLLSFVAVANAFAQEPTISKEPLSERRVSYTMNVTLNPETKTVTGTERLTWRNPDSVPVGELQFHLYLNAFKNERSTFMKESGGAHRGFTAGDEDPWGGVQITRMQIVPDIDADLTPAIPSPGATDLTDRIRFIQPDDGNQDDETVISVMLPRPVQPGETITLDIDFESRMPEIVARTGWKMGESGEPFFMVAQWFPKIGVYEIPGQRYVPEDAERGRWNTHQFHANSEFYADFGTYDVTITTPESFVVGASGRIQDEVIEGGYRTVRYLANDVHDFAWTASPDFLVYEDTWRHVSIRLLLQPVHEGQAQRHFNAAKTALERFDEWVGEYPYTTLTLVDGLVDSNGMEYPTLITCGTYYKVPEWLRGLELVTIHEFGHQYFYGLLASNEFEEAWLDEGMNSYIETRIMDDAYGVGAVIDIAGLQVSDISLQRVAYTKSKASRVRMVQNSWEYPFGDYGTASYSKPSTVMHTLERYLGWETMRRFLRTYYERWRFRHPTTRDLQDVAEDVSGQDLDWFFDQFVYGTATVDYAIDPPLLVSPQSEEGDEVQYRHRVRIVRNGDGIFPQTLLVQFDDGSEEVREWDGEEKWIEFEFLKPARMSEAYIDPDNRILIDTNRLNNRRIRNTLADGSLARMAQLRLASFVHQLLVLLSGLL